MAYDGNNTILQKLDHLIQENGWAPDFEAAVASVRAIQPPIAELVSVRDLPSYFQWLEKYLNWVPFEGPGGTEIYQFLCAFNFVLNQPTLAQLQSQQCPQPPPYPAPITPLSQWMIDFANLLGQNLDQVGTVTPVTLASFLHTSAKEPVAGMDKAPGYRVGDYTFPPGVSDWTQATFNQLFAREFNNIDVQRPVFAPDDDTEIVNAADSAFDNAFPISADSRVTFPSPDNDVQIKTLTWSIHELLAGSKYADAFAGGVFMHAFLGPGDYHRQHAPVSGTIRECFIVPGNVYLELILDQTGDDFSRLIPRRKILRAKEDLKSDVKATILDAPDNPGYQFCQARGVIIIENDTLGLVAMLPIGMTQVSSVKLDDRTKPNATVIKGQLLSHFEFGGSDYVMCFQAKANIDLCYIQSFIKKDNPHPWFPVRGQYIKANPSKE